MNHGVCLRCCLTLLAVGLCRPAIADGTQSPADTAGPREVLQNRRFASGHELVVLGGVMPTDPYFKAVMGSVGYVYHLSDWLAVEAVRFTYAQNLPTKLKHELDRVSLQAGIEPPVLPRVRWKAASYLVLKPLYGKQSFLNRSVAHVELFVQSGPALAALHRSDEAWAFGIDTIAGARLWLRNWLSLRLDVGEFVQVRGPNLKSQLHLMVGVAFNARGES